MYNNSQKNIIIYKTADDGKKYNVTFYSLDMILAIGFRVRSKRGTQFRVWANKNLKEYMVKGFVILLAMPFILPLLLRYEFKFRYSRISKDIEQTINELEEI